MLEHAREVGGRNLRKLTFHERAALLKTLARFLTEHKDDFYTLSYATGATKGDSWIDIDGASARCSCMRAKGTRELPDSRVYVDGGVEALSKTGLSVGQHICVPLEGAAVHINAFNFPVWGMLESWRRRCSPGCRRSSAGLTDLLPHRTGVQADHGVCDPAGRRRAAHLRRRGGSV